MSLPFTRFYAELAACDVRNSTAAVQGGEYKHVNTVAAAAVSAR